MELGRPSPPLPAPPPSALPPSRARLGRSMELGRPSLRLLAALLSAALPPVVAYAVLERLESSWIDRLGVGTALPLAVTVTIGWGGGVGLLSWRAFAGGTR